MFFDIGFKRLHESLEQQVICERTFPDTLYHATNIHNLNGMIKTNTINLRFTFGSQSDAGLNKGKSFFFSMSYDKYGRYANLGYRKTSERPPYEVILCMDTDALQSAGKLTDADYWGDMKRDYNDDEKEVRFVSNKSSLTPANKFIKEAHVYVGSDDRYKLHWIGELLKLKKDFPVYYYNNPSQFKATLKNKAISPEEVQKRTDASVLEPDDVPYDTYKRRAKERYRADIKGLIDVILGVPEEKLTKRGKEYADYAVYYGYDFPSIIDCDLHNARTSGLREFEQLSKLLRSKNIKTYKEMQAAISDNYYKRQY